MEAIKAHQISIHAPREGGDQGFNGVNSGIAISIHAPREGGDVIYHNLLTKLVDFNPRPPRGGRPGWG